MKVKYDKILGRLRESDFRSASEEENFYSYGIQFDTAVSSPSCSRIGNASLHRELPIQNLSKACVKRENGLIAYYLNPSDWTKKADGTASNLDGTDGDIGMQDGAYFAKFETAGSILKVKVSIYPLPGFTYVPPAFNGAYEATVQRSLNKLCSVMNTTADFRGGNNNATWDATDKTLLGRPATSISRIDFRTYARNKGSVNWNMQCYNPYKMRFWLFAIEYNTLNSQAPINAALDANGFKQGGLGDGVTNLDSTKWSNWNGNNPFVPCGYSNSLGSGTGAVSLTMPFGYDGGTAYKGDYNVATAYAVNDFVSSGTSLYKCIQANTGQAVTNTSYYTVQTRTVTNVNRYRGIELPFGHIFKWTDQVNIRMQADSAGGLSQVYVCDDPALFSNTDYTGYTLCGNLARVDGYIREVLFGANGDILPAVTGGSSSTYFCDYFSTSLPASGEVLRGVVFGGSATSSAPAGLALAIAANAPSSAHALIGARLCYIGA